MLGGAVLGDHSCSIGASEVVVQTESDEKNVVCTAADGNKN